MNKLCSSHTLEHYTKYRNELTTHNVDELQKLDII